MPRLKLTAIDRPASGVSTMLEPVACLILQGTKRVAIGDVTLEYGVADYLLAALDVPATGSIAAIPTRPYVAVGLTLDRTVLAELIETMPPSPPDVDPRKLADTSFAIGRVTDDQLEAWARLLALLDRPDDIALLALARERELLYRLLQGPLGHHLRQIAREDGRLAKIRRATQLIRDRYAEALPIAELASAANMSVACFHRHFRATMAMSPLQYQKALRLQAARRSLASGLNASEAAFAVGYGSISQFSREYRRHFGRPPSHDCGMTTTS